MQSARPCRSWLPAAALQTGAAEALLSDALRAWSRDWLARRHLALSGGLVRSEDVGPLGHGTPWFAHGDAVGLCVPESAQLVLARAMLDAADGDTPATDRERRIVDDLVRAALDDLRSRLSVFGLGDGERWSELPVGERPQLAEQWAVAISLGGGMPLLEFAISNDAVIAVVKGALPRPTTARRISSRTHGLLNQHVQLSARIGHISVSLADLAELSPGDVIVFDTDLSDRATLAIDAQPRPGFECSVERREDGFALELLHSLRG